MPCESAHFPDGFVDAVAVVDLREKMLKALLGHVRGDILEIKPGAGSFKRAFIDVRGKYLD